MVADREGLLRAQTALRKAVEHDVSGHQLGERGGRERLIAILFQKDAARFDIHHIGAAGSRFREERRILPLRQRGRRQKRKGQPREHAKDQHATTRSGRAIQPTKQESQRENGRFSRRAERRRPGNRPPKADED